MRLRPSGTVPYAHSDTREHKRKPRISLRSSGLSLLARGLALALLVTPNVVRAESAIVRSGVKSQIAFHMALSSRTCEGYRIVIEILNAPTNGTLTTEPKNRAIRPVTSRGGQQLPQCIGKTATGLAIF